MRLYGLAAIRCVGYCRIAAVGLAGFFACNWYRLLPASDARRDVRMMVSSF